MSRDLYIGRLDELPKRVLNSKNIYSLDLLAKSVQLTWDAQVAQSLLPYLKKRNKIFLIYRFFSWEIIMELPNCLSKKFYPSLEKSLNGKEFNPCH